jgi:hypothetical protein
MWDDRAKPLYMVMCDTVTDVVQQLRMVAEPFKFGFSPAKKWKMGVFVIKIP